MCRTHTHHSRFVDFVPYFILIYFTVEFPSGLYDVVSCHSSFGPSVSNKTGYNNIGQRRAARFHSHVTTEVES